ncbi:MAG: secretin N-terminal domain-containing protein [Candidatus Babeliaceae bacterium]|jgi:general secretion pathway protein D
MKKLFLFMFGACVISNNMYADQLINHVPATEPAYTQLATIQEEVPFYAVETDKKKKKKEPLIKFNFDNEDLVKIINMIASKKKINIILPQGADVINQKITFKLQKKITLAQAEKYLSMFLNLSGYSMYPDGNFFVIAKNDPNINRVPLPLFINVAPAEIPHSEMQIRAVYYLANLKVPENTMGSEPLNLMIKDMMSTNGTYVFDPKSNGVIIIDKANNISSIATILTELDTSGTRDVIALVPLYNSVARTVADLLKTQIVASSVDARGIIRTDLKTESGIYFATNTRVVPDDRRNTIIIMGKETAVERLKDFIREYMDAPAESGNSILHAYDLQYLDAEDFAKVLQDIVTPKGASGQSQKDSATGPMQFFEGVRIVPETYKPVQSAKAIAGGSTLEETGVVFQGGNRLIIAARKKDWDRIKALIHRLDKPQRQVIIEVLVVDLSVNNNKIFGSQVRNPIVPGTPPGLDFQSAQLIGPVLNNPDVNTPPTTIAADLLRILLGSTTSMATLLTSSQQFSGGLILSINDPNGSGVWAVFQLLDNIIETKLISHPFLVTLDNVRGEEIITNIRRAPGNQSIGEGGISTINQKDFEATFKVAITPRISSLDRLNLQITIEIEDFTSPSLTDFSRQTRRVQTNANMNSGQVLVLGGLTRLETTETDTETPILGQIPLVGWFFRNKTKTTVKNNLGIFICPTIVEPKLREGQKKYTGDKIKYSYSTIGESATYDNIRDPITRFFFMSGDKSETTLTQYLADSKEGSYNFESQEREILEPKKIKTSINTETPTEEDRALKALLKDEKNPISGGNE